MSGWSASTALSSGALARLVDRFRRPTLRTRLTLTYAAAFAAAGIVLVAILSFSLAAALDKQPTDTVRVAITEVTNGTISGLELEPIDGSWNISSTTPPESAQSYIATDPASGTAAPSLTELSDRVTALNEQIRASTMRTVLLSAVAALLTTLALAVWFGWIMASRVLAPLNTVTATARRVAGTNLHERIALDGPPDEIKDLADTFDEMLERLDRSFDAQRRFTANASHELRTPLTINRTVLEVAAGDPAASETTRQLSATLLAVNERQERILEGLLTLASADQCLPKMTPVDLGEVVEHIVGEARGSAREAGVNIDVVLGPEPTVIAGDQVLAERLVRNLVDNAVRYNDSRGTVKVSVRSEIERVGITVENSGPLVPSDEVAGLFEPFRRLTEAGLVADRTKAGGAGLGLSIVQAVVTAHEGSIDATARTDGGLRITAWFGKQPLVV